jgi:uncharacterized membrane protein YhfC
MFSVIIKTARVIFGSLGVILVVFGFLGLTLGMADFIAEKEDPRLLARASEDVKIGAILFLVGFPLFGVCAGGLKRPLYFLLPIILSGAFILPFILLPKNLSDHKGGFNAMIALAVTILAYRYINGYYSKREEAAGKQETEKMKEP